MQGIMEVTMVVDYSMDDKNHEENSTERATLIQQDDNQLPRVQKHPTDCKHSVDRTEGRTDQYGSENEVNNSDGQKKRKRRRGKNKGGKNHRKKWKPYNKLSWTERRELDERETVRATQKRQDAFASGHPVAPYNTTQFLMNDHDTKSPDLHVDETGHNQRKDEGSGSMDADYSSSDFCDSSGEDEMFLAKEFLETYENIQSERLQTMNKNELVKECLSLETRVERLEKRLKVSDNKFRRSGGSSDGQSLSSSGEEFVDMMSVKRYEDEIKRLREENDHLRRHKNIEMASNTT